MRFVSQKRLESHWKVIYDEFWTLKDDGLAKLMLRKENELLIKQTRLKILYTIHNTIISLSFLEQSEKTIKQKFRLMDLYKNQTKNDVNRFISLSEFLDKVKSSIANFENTIEKLEKEIRTGEEKVQNEFEIMAELSMHLPFSLNPQIVVVKEYLGYSKRVKQQQRAKKENGKG